MALTRFGFIVIGDEFEQELGTARFQMHVIGVRRPGDGVPAAQRLAARGVQLIELCGGFGPVDAGRIVEAIDAAIPIGVVAYGPQAIEPMHRLFS